MTRFLQILLTLGLLAFIVGIVEGFAGRTFLFTPQGYWRGAMALWMLLIATRAVYLEKR
ncbi:MAG: hypothetical protein ABR961_16460 [Thermoanaerobaculaceae bacterium]|jgi:hypothetical protein